MSNVPGPTHHYLGYDEHGLTHVPTDTATAMDEARCRPLFGVDQPIDITVKIVPIEIPVTCLECIVRFTTKTVFFYNREDSYAAQETLAQSRSDPWKEGTRQTRSRRS